MSDWVYSGVFRDVYREFMIQVNEEYLCCRGENTYTLVHACVCLQTRRLSCKALGSLSRM